MTFPNIKAAWKKDFVYKKVAGLEISLTVWANKNVKGVHPVILNCHPGGLTGGDRFTWLPEYAQEEALDRGVVYVSADYRLMPYANAEEILSDLLAAYDWVWQELPKVLEAENLGSVDFKRIGLIGLSAGGWCATAISDYHKDGEKRAKALYLIYPEVGVDKPYYNSYKPGTPIMGIVSAKPEEQTVDPKKPLVSLALPDFTKSRDEHKAAGKEALEQFDQALYCLFMIEYGMYADVMTGEKGLSKKLADSQSDDERRQIVGEKYKKLFPQLNTTKSTPPTVIIHGEADNGIPCSDSVWWKKEFDRVGVECMLVTVPDAYHGFEVGVVNDDSNEIWKNYSKKTTLHFLDNLLLP